MALEKEITHVTGGLKFVLPYEGKTLVKEGYTFTGWKDLETGKIWNSTELLKETVEKTSYKFLALWTDSSYYTIYFKSFLGDPNSNDVELITPTYASVYKDGYYTTYEIHTKELTISAYCNSIDSRLYNIGGKALYPIGYYDVNADLMYLFTVSGPYELPCKTINGHTLYLVFCNTNNNPNKDDYVIFPEDYENIMSTKANSVEELNIAGYNTIRDASDVKSIQKIDDHHIKVTMNDYKVNIELLMYSGYSYNQNTFTSKELAKSNCESTKNESIFIEYPSPVRHVVGKPGVNAYYILPNGIRTVIQHSYENFRIESLRDIIDNNGNSNFLENDILKDGYIIFKCEDTITDIPDWMNDIKLCVSISYKMTIYRYSGRI